MRRLLAMPNEWRHTFRQWRAAAAVPRLVNQSRELLERKLAENRQQTAALIKGLADTADAKVSALEAIVAKHSETTKKVVAEMRGQLASAEIVAEHIRVELEHGALAWKQAKADFETERQRSEQARKQLEARQSWHNFLRFALLVAGLIGIGIAIGMWIVR